MQKLISIRARFFSPLTQHKWRHNFFFFPVIMKPWKKGPKVLSTDDVFFLSSSFLFFRFFSSFLRAPVFFLTGLNYWIHGYPRIMRAIISDSFSRFKPYVWLKYVCPRFSSWARDAFLGLEEFFGRHAWIYGSMLDASSGLFSKAV